MQSGAHTEHAPDTLPSLKITLTLENRRISEMNLSNGAEFTVLQKSEIFYINPFRQNTCPPQCTHVCVLLLLLFSWFFLETGFLCVALNVLELTL